MALPKIFEHLRLPVVAAPMFLVSNKELVIECSRSGIVGTFPALNLRTSLEFENWVQEILSVLQRSEIETGIPPAPFGVNLIVHKSNPRLKEDLAICVKHRVPLVITSLGAATEVIDAVHSYGGIVFHDVTNLKHAEKAAAAGVDGLIAVCAGAGGHAGKLNPFALIGQIRQFFDKTLILAGAISSGSDVLAAKAMGADLAYMGTRFINTLESQAPIEYKQMILEAEADDIVYTPAVSGVPANFLKKSLEKAGLMNGVDDEEVNLGEKLSMNDEAKKWKTIWSAGHGVSNISDTPKTTDLVSRLEKEYKDALARLNSSL